jgi:hypothetical protein
MLLPELLDLFQGLSLGLRHTEVDPYPGEAAEQREQAEGQCMADRPYQRQEELADQEGRTVAVGNARAATSETVLIRTRQITLGR